jgi:hypothetical protein
MSTTSCQGRRVEIATGVRDAAYRKLKFLYGVLKQQPVLAVESKLTQREKKSPCAV